MLAAAGVDAAPREARLLLAHAEGLDATALLLAPERGVDRGRFAALVARRAAREPLAFITGWQEFWSLRFAVSPATLIPRPDSETVVAAALAAAPGAQLVLDLGTGTGCLLLAALSELPGAWGVGTDRIPAAARLAAANARALGLAGRAAILCADWAAPLAGRFDLVLANPPYVEAAAVAGLMPEVARHEPASALAGGADGLAAYRAVVAALPRLLAPGGAAVLELGAGQEAAVARLAQAAGLVHAATRPDLAGIPRAMVLRALASGVDRQ